MADNNYQYLMNGARLTNYSVIPNTVCEMNISSTAKVIYAKFLNRAQLSASNGFVDGLGRAYVIYTIEDLSKELGKCNSTIKDNLRELARVGLVEKKLFNVIDRRYRTGKPLIITTNLHIDTMRNETSIDKKRIYDRVFEMCAPVQMKGVSKRKISADNKIKLLRELNNRED